MTKCYKCGITVLHDANGLAICACGAIQSSRGFVTEDSGQREDFQTGARRDVQVGKPRYELIPVAALKRLANLYARGAEKYGEGNFEKGIPFKRMMASLLRHAYQYLEGDQDEDHLAAVAWNAFAIMFYEDRIERKLLPAELDDIHTEK